LNGWAAGSSGYFESVFFGEYWNMSLPADRGRGGRWMAAVVASLVAWCGQALAADPPGEPKSSGLQQESVKIEPYKGPPIFLDQPEKINVAPTIVARELIRETFGGGRVEKQVAKFSDNSLAADGVYREFHPNGKPFIEGQFVKGRQEGEWTYYYDNGQMNRKVTFKDGKPNGSWEVFRADGTKMAKRGFKDGLRDGEWINYDDSGKKPRSEEHYLAGEKDGVWKTWYPSGQQRQQASFKNGKLNGSSIEWDDKGVKRVEAEYADGKLHGTLTVSRTDGTKIVNKYEKGQLISESKQ
jgi:antitoxin component YwqK of YwqJK toxin-antitoxin module